MWMPVLLLIKCIQHKEMDHMIKLCSAGNWALWQVFLNKWHAALTSSCLTLPSAKCGLLVGLWQCEEASQPLHSPHVSARHWGRHGLSLRHSPPQIQVSAQQASPAALLCPQRRRWRWQNDSGVDVPGTIIYANSDLWTKFS